MSSTDSKTPHGFFHSIKEKMFHGEKHVDTDYEAVLHKFQQLHDSMYKIKTSCANYTSSVYSVFSHSNSAALDFSLLLEEASVSNPYQSLAIQTRTSHNRLNSEKQQQIANELTERVLKPIEDTLRSFGSLQQRIQKRNELHNDLEYYLNKVHGLSKERDDRSLKGKSEKSGDLEKFDRNQQKLSVARTEYTNFTSLLMTDLNNAWNNRIALLGPALASFVEAEKHFLEIYGNELNGVAKSDQLVQTPAQPIAPQHLAPGDLPSAVVQGDLQANPQPGLISSQQTQQHQQQGEVLPAGGESNPFLSPHTHDAVDASAPVQPAPSPQYNPVDSRAQTDTNKLSNEFASNVVVDPSNVMNDHQSYTYSTATPGTAATTVTQPTQYNNESALYQKGEDESKRQRIEQDEKAFV